MANYSYYCVESTFVARYDKDGDTGYQRYMESGEWEQFNDSWDVVTNGKWIPTEAEALKMAQEIFERDRQWRAEGKA